MTPDGEKSDKYGTTLNPPAVGLNDNLEFLGRQLHIQTEFIELPIARIVTQVFCGGRVMLSRKSECPPDFQDSQDLRRLQQTMNFQHHQVIKEIADKQIRALSSKEPPVHP